MMIPMVDLSSRNQFSRGNLEYGHFKLATTEHHFPVELKT